MRALNKSQQTKTDSEKQNPKAVAVHVLGGAKTAPENERVEGGTETELVMSESEGKSEIKIGAAEVESEE